MKLPLLDTALWAAGPMLNAALFCVICIRRLLRTFPILALWCAFTIASAVALFLIYRQAPHRSYAIAYWIVEGVDALLQIGVIAEVTHIVFHPRTTDERGPRLVPLIAIVTSIAFFIAWWIHPISATRAGVWEIRGDLLTSLIVSGMFTLVLITSQRYGFHWRSHVMSIGYGLTVWSILGLVLGLLHSYWGRYSHYLAVEHIRMATYLGIFTYWIVALWRNEPERELATPEMRNAVLQATDRVSYDLAKALGTREKELH